MNTIMADVLCCAAGQIVNLLLQAADISKRQHRGRLHPYLQERKSKGRFATDFEDLVHCNQRFKENFHMDYESFQEIFSLVQAKLQPKRQTHPNNAISAKEKLAIVLDVEGTNRFRRLENFNNVLFECICKEGYDQEQPQKDMKEAIRKSKCKYYNDTFKAKWKEQPSS